MTAQLNICVVTKDTPFGKGLKLFYSESEEITLKVSDDQCSLKDFDVVLYDIDSYNWHAREEVLNKTIFVSDFKNNYQNFIVVAKKTTPQQLDKQIALAAKESDLTGSKKTKFQNVTTRESEILHYLCEGLSTREIASLCAVSVGTINAHRLSIIEKYGAKNTANLIYTMLKKLKE